MILHHVWQLVFDFFPGKDVEVMPVDEMLSSDGGLVVIRQWDQQGGLTAGFASQLVDRRHDPKHTILEMVRSRVFGILAGYEDQNDHDSLRSDPIFKLIADRSPDGDDLASQPTLSRLENAVTPADLLRLEEWFVQRFVDSFDEVPTEITLDVDGFDDPTHGKQQLTLFHGFYRQYQYMVRVMTCAENDAVILPVLLWGTADVARGLEDDIERVVKALRARFPEVLIRFRADSGFAKPRIYQQCERLGVEYSIGIPMNPILKNQSETLLNQAVEQYQETDKPQRLFTGCDYQAGTWEQSRWVVIKCEANGQGTNRRAVVTNRPGARVMPGGVYDEFSERGESENRNKELKCELAADRLSDHRYMANCFRMFLHCLAANMLVSLRRHIANPPPEIPPTKQPLDEAPHQAALPAEARTGRARRRDQNRRRQADPLGEGHACTWRTRLIKVAARVEVRARCVRILLAGTWPFLDGYREIGEALIRGS